MALVAGTYMMLVFITPLTLEPGTVPELSGRANLIDYATVDGWGPRTMTMGKIVSWVTTNSASRLSWMDHGPLVALVYSIGDLNCHQKSERAFMVNGNQTAVCAEILASSSDLLLVPWLGAGGV